MVTGGSYGTVRITDWTGRLSDDTLTAMARERHAGLTPTIVKPREVFVPDRLERAMQEEGEYNRGRRR